MAEDPKSLKALAREFQRMATELGGPVRFPVLKTQDVSGRQHILMEATVYPDSNSDLRGILVYRILGMPESGTRRRPVDLLDENGALQTPLQAHLIMDLWGDESD